MLNSNNRIFIVLLLIIFNINALFIPFNLDISDHVSNTNDAILSLTYSGSFVPANAAKKPAFKHLSSYIFFTFSPSTFLINIPLLNCENKSPFNFRQKIERILSNYFNGTKYKYITSKIYVL